MVDLSDRAMTTSLPEKAVMISVPEDRCAEPRSRQLSADGAPCLSALSWSGRSVICETDDFVCSFSEATGPANFTGSEHVIHAALHVFGMVFFGNCLGLTLTPLVPRHSDVPVHGMLQHNILKVFDALTRASCRTL